MSGDELLDVYARGVGKVSAAAQELNVVTDDLTDSWLELQKLLVAAYWAKGRRVQLALVIFAGLLLAGASR